MENYFILESK